MAGLTFDPWRHAAHLGVDVLEHPLPPGRRGHYYHHEHIIIIAPGLTQRQARCTLTHEVMHAARGDVWHPDSRVIARMERAVDAMTALQLITVADYARAECLHGPHESAVAHELNVTRDVVRTWCTIVQAEMQRAA